MASTYTAIKEFEKTIDNHTLRPKQGQTEKIVKNIERVVAEMPRVYSTGKVGEYLTARAKLLTRSIEEYFGAVIGERFPLLSNELFDLKRYVSLEKHSDKKWVIVKDDTEESKSTPKGQTTVIAIDLFAYSPLFNNGKEDATKLKLGSFTKTKRTGSIYSGYNTKRQTVSIEAKLKGDLGLNLRRTAQEALHDYFSILAEAYSKPFVGDVLLGQDVSLQEKLKNPEIGAIWIPTVDSLSVKATAKIIRHVVADPAMVLTVNEHKYLVKTWKMDDEEPLEAYLREFSIGSLKGKVK